MKSNNIILDRSYKFALKIIEIYKYLRYSHKEFEISKQVLQCGTSIGANAEEACSEQSGKDFIAKFSISLKEANKTHYWIRLLKDSHYLEPEQANDILSDCEEIIKTLTSILKNSRQSGCL